MQLTVTGRDIPLTKSLRDYVEKRLERVKRHIPKIMGIEAVLRKERQDHVVHIRLTAPRFGLSVTGRSPDMYASIDEAVDKLERASRKQKERKIQTPRLRAIRQRKVEAVEQERTVARREEETEVVTVNKVGVKPMSVDEALLQLKTLEYTFLVFRDSDDGEMKVIYRRSNGTFGLIEPGQD